MISIGFKSSEKGCNKLTEFEGENLEFGSSPTIEPRGSMSITSLKGGKNVSTSDWRGVPRMILSRKVRPKHFEDLNGVIMTNVGSKNAIPLLVDSAQGIIWLINNMPLLINDEVVGLILCFILEVVINVSSRRLGGSTNLVFPGIDALELEVMLTLLNLTLEPEMAFMQCD